MPHFFKRKAKYEALMKHHPPIFLLAHGLNQTMHGCQFDWGGLLPKGNGGVRRQAHAEDSPWRSARVNACLTVRSTDRAGMNKQLTDSSVVCCLFVGPSDPRVS
jgi:hypothetical protein